MVEKVALVTGAGAGIGRACALALAKEGYRLILAGRRREPLESCAEEIANWGGDVFVVPTDVGKEEEVTALFLQVESTFGRIDLLFNNAGTGTPPVPIDELSFQQWQRVVDVNLTGTFLCAQAAFKLMKKQLPAGGRIINNGSVSAISPRPNSAPYTATKHAITGLTKSLSLDGREHNIACGQIDIGNALTDMTQVMKSGVPQANGKIAPESTMDVDDVARSVVFMAGLPLESNVQFMTVMATAMPLIGRG
jgi:NAD(P)-dependent dehydrogenase (short-subunit alcohol dehydrogenase family)